MTIKFGIDYTKPATVLCIDVKYVLDETRIILQSKLLTTKIRVVPVASSKVLPQYP